MRRLIVLLATLLAVAVATAGATAGREEAAGPYDGHANADGIPNSRQANVSSVPNAATDDGTFASSRRPTLAHRQTSTVEWTNPSGGDWSDGSNWSTGAAPTATDDVVVDIPVRAPITYAGTTSQINSLISSQDLEISGTLEIADTLQSDAALSVIGGTVVSGGSQIYNGAVTADGQATFQATGAKEALQFNSTLSTGSAAVMLYAAEVDFAGGSNSVTGTGGFLFESSSINTPTIRIGGGSDSGAATLDLTDSDIAALADGFNQIRVGAFFSPNTTLVVDASGATLHDRLLLQTRGDISFAGSLDTSGAAVDASSLAGGISQLGGAEIATHGGAVTLSGDQGVSLNGVITTEGGSVSVSTGSQNARITTGSIVTTASAGSGLQSGAVTLAARGDVSMSGTIVTRGVASAGIFGPAGGAVSITTAQGGIGVTGIDTRGGNALLVGGAGGSITIGAAQFGGTGLGVNGDLLAGSGSGAAPRAGGAISVNVGAFASVYGDLVTNGANVDLRSNGMSVSGTVAVSTSGKVTLDGRGGDVTLNAPISVGQGGIEIHGAKVDFGQAITTVGGNVDIATNPGSRGLVRGPVAASSITTTSGGAGISSGSVTIVGDGGVDLTGNVVTRGPDNGSSLTRGGSVSISARGGSIRLRGIDTRGGSGTTNTPGGSITITGSGAIQSTTSIGGALLAGGGTQDATGSQAPGGAILVNNSVPRPTSLLQEVRTNDASIDIGGEGLFAQSPISTSGSGKVTMRGFDGAVTLHEAVTAGSGGIDLSGNGIDFWRALATSGGPVVIRSTGAAGAVTGSSGARITTDSGPVTIVGNTGVSLAADIVTAGPTNNAGQGLRGGEVRLSTPNAAISLAGIDSRGGDSIPPVPQGGPGGTISISAGGVGSPTVVNGDLLAGGGAGTVASGRAPGGAIQVNSAGFFGKSTLVGNVQTNGSFVDLRGTELTVRGAITTSGAVTLRGGSVMRLEQAVRGLGGIDLEITDRSASGSVQLAGALVTEGGNVAIRSGPQVSVTDTLSPSSFPTAISITTTAAPNSGRPSGGVTIATGAVYLPYSSIDTSGAYHSAGALSAAGEVRITVSNGILDLKGIDARGGASSAPAFRGDGGAIAVTANGVVGLRGAVRTDGPAGVVMRSSQVLVELQDEVQAGSGGLEILGSQGVKFTRDLRTRGGDVDIRTGPTGEVIGLTRLGVGGQIETTALDDSGARSGDVTITGHKGVRLSADVFTDGADNDLSGAVSAGGDVQIVAPGGSIRVTGVSTRDGSALGITPSFGGGSITLQAGGTNSTLTVEGRLTSGTAAISLDAQDNVVFGNGGGLAIVAVGLAAGSYTKVTASDTMLLNGDGLVASFVSGFSLAQGDRLPFYRTPQAQIQGTFDSEQLPPHAATSYGTDVIELVWEDSPPEITSNGGDDSAEISVPENQLPVTAVTATDPESDTVTFSLSGNDDQLFELVTSGSNTALRFRSAPDFEAPQDIGRDNVYDVTLVATDAFGETDEQELAVTVTGVNEPPVLTVISPVTILTGRTDVEIVSAADPDRPAQTLTFSLGGTDGADLRLVADPQGKRLQFVNTPDVNAPADADANNVYELTVTVDDGGGASATRPVQVTVRAVPVQTVGINDQVIPEGQSGTTTQGTFTVTLSQVAAQTVTIDYQTLDGTAVAGSDYVARSGTVTFMVGQRFRPVPIDVKGDEEVEADETFEVLLSNPVGAVLGAPLPGLSPRATGTILNDDYPLVGLISPFGPDSRLERMVPEIQEVKLGRLEGNSGTSTLVFPVSLTQAASSDVDVNYQVVPQPAMGALGSATAGDYVVGSGTLTFVPGERVKGIDVTINGDTSVEPNEAFKVILTSASGATVVPAAQGTGFQPEAIGIIVDDDGLEARDDAYTVTQGRPLVVAAPGLLANDIERDLTALPLLVANAPSGPASGTVNLGGNGAFAYIPNVSFSGTDTFVYEVWDTLDRFSRATVTITVPPDGDLDGVADAVEAAAPNGGDGNADGITDSTQPGVASLPAAISGQYVTLVASSGATLAYVTATATLPPNPPVGSSFPLGLLGFALRGVQPGGSAQVTLLLPSGVSINAYHKFGREPGNTTPHWYAFNYNGTTGAQMSGATVTLNFVDGQRGDGDLAANGVIFDPGGPSIANRRPVITSDGGRRTAKIIALENTTGVTTVKATDADGDALRFSLTPRFDAAKFSIHPKRGVVMFDAAPDFESPTDADGDNVYELVVRVDDGHGGRDQQALRVSVADVRGRNDRSRR